MIIIIGSAIFKPKCDSYDQSVITEIFNQAIQKLKEEKQKKSNVGGNVKNLT